MFAILIETGDKLRAKRVNGQLMIGGDYLAKGEQSQYIIVSNDKMYKIQGSRLIFTDNYIPEEWGHEAE